MHFPRTLLMWVQMSTKSRSEKPTIRCETSPRYQVIIKNKKKQHIKLIGFWKTRFGPFIWLEKLHWRHSTAQISFSKAGESADRSRRSGQMTGQVPGATVWQELSQAPLAHRTQGEYCGRPWSPHTSAQKKKKKEKEKTLTHAAAWLCELNRKIKKKTLAMI